MEKNQYHVTLTTNKKIEEVINDLEKKLKEVKFGVLWKFNIHDKMEEKGIEFPKKITVLEVCNPHEASDILDLDPMASYFLPCKIVVTEENHITTVGLVRPSLLIGLMEDEQLVRVAEAIEEKLVSAIENTIET